VLFLHYNKYLNNEFLQQRFTSGEQDAIAYSVKGGHAPGDGWGWVTDNGGWNSPFCPIGWADHARIFILDAHEATNASYGFAKDIKSTYDTMNGVKVPVTVVEGAHDWGEPTYDWSADNSKVTGRHTCYTTEATTTTRWTLRSAMR